MVSALISKTYLSVNEYDRINNKAINSKDEWSSEQHARAFLKKSNNMPHRLEGQEVLFDHISNEAIRVLDFRTGDGRLLRLPINKRPDIHAVAMDISPLRLEMVE